MRDYFFSRVHSGNKREEEVDHSIRWVLLGFEEAVGLDDGAGMAGRRPRGGVARLGGGPRSLRRVRVVVLVFEGLGPPRGVVVVVGGLAFDGGGDGGGDGGEGRREARGEDGGDGGAHVDGLADDELREDRDEPGAVPGEGLRVEAVDDVEGVEGEGRRRLREARRGAEASFDCGVVHAVGGAVGVPPLLGAFVEGVLVEEVPA
mmetsp:Transcript_29721/g.95851  ORF Transcript_29721/g.95851 Transcript_29721/m.95851 type:complete len:204 (-) Transcript_29721:3750-4361(-)